MNSGSSAFIHSGSQLTGWSLVSSVQHTSRPSVQARSSGAVRWYTTTFLHRGRAVHGQRFVHGGLQRHGSAAAQAFVGGDHQLGAGIFDAVFTAPAEKPPNTTEWMAPMRAQACMATMASATIGM